MNANAIKDMFVNVGVGRMHAMDMVLRLRDMKYQSIANNTYNAFARNFHRALAKPGKPVSDALAEVFHIVVDKGSHKFAVH
jgi:hypothetical protein